MASSRQDTEKSSILLKNTDQMPIYCRKNVILTISKVLFGSKYLYSVMRPKIDERLYLY